MVRLKDGLLLWLLVWAPLCFGQKLEWISHSRIGLGQNHESIESLQDLPITEALERDRKFYTVALGTTFSRETTRSQWRQNLDLESGDAWDEDARYRQVSAGSSYEYRELKDRFRLGLSATKNQGDLSYKRPPLVELSGEDEFSSGESLYYGLSGGYTRQLGAFASLNLETQTSVFRQRSTDIRSHQFGVRYQQLVNPFWDTGLAWNGNWQENRETETTSRALALAWANNFRPSFQDFFTHAIGAIRSQQSTQDQPTHNYTMTLSYTHLFQNNKMIEPPKIQTQAAPADSGTEAASNSGLSGGQLPSGNQLQSVLEQMQRMELSNLISVFWLRNLSSLEQGSEQFVSEQVGINYAYTHAQGHGFEAGISQNSQFDPDRRSRVQRKDQALRLAFSELIKRTESPRPELFDRLGLQYQQERVFENNQNLSATRWVAEINYEARF